MQRLGQKIVLGLFNVGRVMFNVPSNLSKSACA